MVWKSAKEHPLPSNLLDLPVGHDEVKELWEALGSQGSEHFRTYMKCQGINAVVVGEALVDDAVGFGFAKRFAGLTDIQSGTDLVPRGLIYGFFDTHTDGARAIMTNSQDTIEVSPF